MSSKLSVQIWIDQKAFDSDFLQMQRKWTNSMPLKRCWKAPTQAHQSKLIFLVVYSLSMYSMIGAEALMYLFISLAADSSVEGRDG